MRFQVPQFIEVEDKIFGPLTLKQFIYVAGGAGLSFVIYFLLGSLFLSLLPIVIIMAISCALAFYKVNNKPLIGVAEAAFRYWLGAKLYIWKKEEKPRVQTEEEAVKQAKNYASVMVPKISDSKLKDLSWSLDIKESVYADKTQH
ncbi:MAG: PrgI family protein [Candidatus Taylorbacteria bacterium]|nr:PrgI family protein [Candidatus Taylorbacteria bacterium]